MKTHHPKLKTQPRQLFSCAFFRHCTQTALSPTTPTPPALPLSPSSPPTQPLPPPPPSSLPPPPPPHSHPPPPQKTHQPESSSSSSSSTSQSFTQWRFPLANSPLHHEPDPQSVSDPKLDPTLPTDPPPLPLPVPSAANLLELFHAAELQLSTGSESEQLTALYLLERSLVPNPPVDPICSLELMKGVVAKLRNKAGVKSATKILFALCLVEGNRHVAVDAGAVGAVVEVVMEMEGASAERALAALELMCTVAEGAAELRSHALVVPVMVTMMGKMTGRGREYAISALAVVYSGGGGGGTGESETEEQVQHAPPEEVARAVVLALRGSCTARGRRKGTQLLKALQEYGHSDLTHEGNQRP